MQQRPPPHPPPNISCKIIWFFNFVMRKRGAEVTKRTWMEAIIIDVDFDELSFGMVYDCVERWNGIHIFNSFWDKMEEVDVQ